MAMDQYLYIPFLVGWTSIYQLFWGSPGVPGFWPIPISKKLNLPRFCCGLHMPKIPNRFSRLFLWAARKSYRRPWTRCLKRCGWLGAGNDPKLSSQTCRFRDQPMVLDGFGWFWGASNFKIPYWCRPQDSTAISHYVTWILYLSIYLSTYLSIYIHK